LTITEDELQNVEMAEEEKLKNRLELKTKKRDYTGYDDDEFQGGSQGLSKRSVLAKYDEQIDGVQQSVRILSQSDRSRYLFNGTQTFRLGSSSLSAKAHREEQKQQAAAALNKSLLSIDYISEFLFILRRAYTNIHN
jgi:U4/U6.U5 tri-snRNP-associated protein 1